VAAASVFVGVAATLAVLAIVGAFDRPVRTVIEQVDVPPTSEPGTDVAAGEVEPALVRVVAIHPGGTVDATGVVVRADGHVLTTADVVDGAEQITVTVDDGSVLPAEVVGIDRTSDLAVVDVEADGLPTARLADVSTLSTGTEAVAVARAAGSETPTISVGRVSGLGWHFATADGSNLYDMIQAALETPMSYGGAVLCSFEGAVLGVFTARSPAADDGAPGYTPTSLAPDTEPTPTATATNGTRNVGYATPIDYASEVADELIDTGRVHHAWLGVYGDDLDPTTAAELGRSGARLTTVTEKGPAAAAGLQVGDIVIALDGRRISSVQELVVALRDHRPGDEVTVRYVRDGEPRRAEVELSGGG
jgi:S1-C subfamily serine protease